MPFCVHSQSLNWNCTKSGLKIRSAKSVFNGNTAFITNSLHTMSVQIKTYIFLMGFSWIPAFQYPLSTLHSLSNLKDLIHDFKTLMCSPITFYRCYKEWLLKQTALEYDFKYKRKITQCYTHLETSQLQCKSSDWFLCQCIIDLLRVKHTCLCMWCLLRFYVRFFKFLLGTHKMFVPQKSVRRISNC